MPCPRREQGLQGSRHQFADRRAGGGRILPQASDQAARQAHREHVLAVGDGQRRGQPAGLAEVAIGLPGRDRELVCQASGGVRQVRAILQQRAGAIEPLDFLGLTDAGHMTYSIYDTCLKSTLPTELANTLELEVTFCVGGVISPVLVNVYLHYVLDAWVQRYWRPRQARGEMIIVCYADDFVLGFQYRSDAERFLRDARERFARYGLDLHPEKTRLIEFGRFAIANRRRRGKGRPESFDFLGFTHYCRETRGGKFGIGRKPIAKRMRRKLQAIKRDLRRRMHDDRLDTARWLGQVLDGWLNYYAVPTSYAHLRRFRRYLQQLWLRTLRRRSQKGKFAWEQLDGLCKRFWPRTEIRHPWPNVRFAVRYSR